MKKTSMPPRVQLSILSYLGSLLLVNIPLSSLNISAGYTRADPAEILTASQGCGTIGRGYGRVSSEEVEKDRSDVKCLCTCTAPPNRKWGGGWIRVWADKPIKASSLENFSLVGKNWGD